VPASRRIFRRPSKWDRVGRCQGDRTPRRRTRMK
jgi:hypothetical protein